MRHTLSAPRPEPVKKAVRNKAQLKNREAEKPERVAKLRQVMSTTTMAGASMVDSNKPLTGGQKLFVKFWAEGDSIPNAMHRAGFNHQPSYGYRMAKMPNILAEYDREKALYEQAAQMTRKKVMDMHLEAFEMAKLMSEPATMVSAAREVGKMCGYYEPVRQKIDITVNGQLAVKRLDALSDEELVKLVSEGMQLMNGASQEAQQALEMAPGDDEYDDPGV